VCGGWAALGPLSVCRGRALPAPHRRWNELFIGDEGQAVLAHGKRSGATLLPTLRTLVTGGPLGQQNAATDNRRIIPAGNY